MSLYQLLELLILLGLDETFYILVTNYDLGLRAGYFSDP